MSYMHKYFLRLYKTWQVSILLHGCVFFLSLLPRMEMQTRAYTTTESDFDKPYENLREKPCKTKNKIHKNTVENITKQGKTYRIFRYIVKQELPNQLKHPKQIVHVLWINRCDLLFIFGWVFFFLSSVASINKKNECVFVFCVYVGYLVVDQCGMRFHAHFQIVLFMDVPKYFCIIWIW